MKFLDDPEVRAEFDRRMAEDAKRKEHELKLAIRMEVEKMELPAKDVELFRTGVIQQTQAMQVPFDTTITVLSGGMGSGKTTAASSWLYRWANNIDNWYEGKIRGFSLFLTCARLARWNRYDENEMRRLFRCTRLVIDDLGVEFLDERGSFMALLDELINERYNRKSPTVITTNLDPATFKARYGERVADRIRECGKFVSISAASMRKKE